MHDMAVGLPGTENREISKKCSRECSRASLKDPPRTVCSTDSDSVAFCYSVVNLLRC